MVAPYQVSSLPPDERAGNPESIQVLPPLGDGCTARPDRDGRTFTVADISASSGGLCYARCSPLCALNML